MCYTNMFVLGFYSVENLYYLLRYICSPTGPFWLVKSVVRLLPSMLAMLILSPSVQ